MLYGDTYLRLDNGAAADAWSRSSRLELMTVLRNEGRWDRSNVVYRAGRVVAYDKTAPAPEMQWIDYGLCGLQRTATTLAGSAERDLAVVYAILAEQGELSASRCTSGSTRSVSPNLSPRPTHSCAARPSLSARGEPDRAGSASARPASGG